MNTVKGFFQSRKIWKRPFDFYTAALIFFAGLFSLVSDDWPEHVNGPIAQVFIVIVSLYLMAAAAVIMSSLLCKKVTRPVFSLMGELYGWMFVSAGSLATSLMYIGGVINDAPASWWAWSILLILWIGMTIASAVRASDLYLIYRSLKP